MLLGFKTYKTYELGFSTRRLANRSQGCTSVDIFTNDLPLNLIYKRASITRRWSAGRSAGGCLIMRTRKKRSVKTRQCSINYNFRDGRLSLLAGLMFAPTNGKLFSLIYLASGSVSYVPTAMNHQLLRLTKFAGEFTRRKKRPTILHELDNKLPVIQLFFLIHQLPKNKPVSLLETTPGKGVQYVRAPGSKGVVVKMDSRISTAVVKLPSGVRKIFSTYGLGSKGLVALPEKRKLSNNKAGHRVVTGRGSIVRGVAMNPVDHPHGGRTKAISHQRTPWGKSTKLK